jgi:acetyltransferase-like isoleucine patch superfamily enzyme
MPITKKNFLDQFRKIINFKKNKYHPLVWISGNPKIGINTFVGGFSEINATKSAVKIGANCDIAAFVSINVADSHKKCIGIAKSIERKEIIIEKNVFIGTFSVIKSGAQIGHHSVVASGSVVDGVKIPPYSLVSGNPMTVKKGYYKKRILNKK